MIIQFPFIQYNIKKYKNKKKIKILILNLKISRYILIIHCNILYKLKLIIKLIDEIKK